MAPGKLPEWLGRAAKFNELLTWSRVVQPRSDLLPKCQSTVPELDYCSAWWHRQGRHSAEQRSARIDADIHARYISKPGRQTDEVWRLVPSPSILTTRSWCRMHKSSSCSYWTIWLIQFLISRSQWKSESARTSAAKHNAAVQQVQILCSSPPSLSQYVILWDKAWQNIPAIKTSVMMGIANSNIIGLKRFDKPVWDKPAVKLFKLCAIGGLLDVRQFCTKERQEAIESTLYRLKSVIVHEGPSMDSGHYYQYNRVD